MSRLITKFKKLFSLFTLLCADIFAYYLTLYLSVKLRNFAVENIEFMELNTLFRFSQFTEYWIFPLLFVAVFMIHDLYTRRKPFWYEAEMYVRSIVIAGVISFSVVGFMRVPYDISRIVVLFQVGLAIFIFPIIRFLVKVVLYRLGIWGQTAVVLTDCELSDTDLDGITADYYLGYHIIGIISDTPSKSSKYTNIGSQKDLVKTLKPGNVQTIICLVKRGDKGSINALINEAYRYVDKVLWVPYNGDLSLMGSSAFHLFNERLFVLEMPNTLKSFENRIVKTVFDTFVGLIALVIGLPVIIFISLLIIIIDGNKPFFMMTRYGKGGKEFKPFKFQTMQRRVSEDKEYEQKVLANYFAKNPKAKRDWEVFKKIRDDDDPRVTKLGKLLRKTSLDEIPQIFNVMLGQMSLVGPRPYLPREREDIGDYFNVILSVKPGMTGLWQVSGRNDVGFVKRLELDAWYIRNWSVWLDVVIFFKTAGVVIDMIFGKRTGAY
ncbi:exopolysaccharide biosynthesis polyprenyl glycosylphosphotransferase [Candidatus Dojkabacteria bacterium]|nr:exopolysaccharide biosynthesis polyprenyl glycosylphosphotransferase [Candidatus Dojkabacteria bacterium]